MLFLLSRVYQIFFIESDFYFQHMVWPKLRRVNLNVKLHPGLNAYPNVTFMINVMSSGLGVLY